MARAKDAETSTHQCQLCAVQLAFLLARAKRSRDAYGAPSLTLWPSDYRPPVQSFHCGLATTAELGLAAGTPVPFTLTPISHPESFIPVDASQQNQRAAGRSLPSPSREGKSILQFPRPCAAPELGATGAFPGLASASDVIVGGVARWTPVEDRPSGVGRSRVDGRRWIISDEHIPGVFRERLQ